MRDSGGGSCVFVFPGARHFVKKKKTGNQAQDLLFSNLKKKKHSWHRISHS